MSVENEKVESAGRGDCGRGLSWFLLRLGNRLNSAAVVGNIGVDGALVDIEPIGEEEEV
jgi:hypothetical protein